MRRPKGRNVKNARGPKVFKPVKWDTKLTPDENVKCLPVLRWVSPHSLPLPPPAPHNPRVVEP